MSNIICIVEPLSSANYLAKRLKQEGFYTVVLRVNNINGVTNQEAINAIRDKVDYLLWDEVIDFDQKNGDIKQLANKLCALKVNQIYYGCEYVVEFTDRLSQILGLPGNNPDTARYRFNKFEMQNALSKDGLKTPKQIMLTNAFTADDIKRIINEIGFPLIVKPVNCFASIGVQVIQNESEFTEFNIVQHFEENSELVFQELITGTEYLIDTFSYNGVHAISLIAAYEKELFANNFLYRSINYIKPDNEIYIVLESYIREVLDAVGMENGFAHTELFVTKNGDKYLVEVNPRLSGAGGTINELAKISSGKDQIDLLSEFLNKKLIDQRILNQNGLVVFIYNFEPNKNFSEVNFELFNKLDSYKSHIVTKSKGNNLNVGGNLFDSFLYVVLANSNMQKLSHDVNLFQQYEAKGLFLR